MYYSKILRPTWLQLVKVGRVVPAVDLRHVRRRHVAHVGPVDVVVEAVADHGVVAEPGLGGQQEAGHQVLEVGRHVGGEGDAPSINILDFLIFNVKNALNYMSETQINDSLRIFKNIFLIICFYSR